MRVTWIILKNTKNFSESSLKQKDIEINSNDYPIFIGLKNARKKRTLNFFT